MIVATDKLKQEVLKREDQITKDGYHQTILNIMYQHWQKEDVDMNYKEILEWFSSEYGELAKFAVLIGKYNQQVCNGGHFQYYSNGYCDGISGCFNEHDIDIPLHKELIQLFNQTELKDEISLKTFKILEELYIELDDEEYIEEEIFDDGETYYEECENPDYMEVVNTDMLKRFDNEYYKINDEFVEILEQYFKDKIRGE